MKQITRKNVAKYLTFMALVGILLFGARGLTAYAAEVVDSGYCGEEVRESVRWELDSDGKLTISGSGTIETVWTMYSPSFYSYDREVKIKTVVIEEGVTGIGSYAFYRCSDITSVSIPNTVTYIGDCVFASCNLTGSIEIPASVTTIRTDRGKTFGGTSLTEIKVDENNPNYCSVDGVLYNKDKTELIECPDGKTGTCEIPDTVTSIANPDYSFSGCTRLTGITIPAGLTEIGTSTFNSLTDIHVAEANPNYAGENGVLFGKDKKRFYYVRGGERRGI